MTYTAESQKAGREPLVVVEIDLDYCTRTYGVAPCAAPSPSTQDIWCYNTRKTCKDTANYASSAKTYRFCEPRAGLPAGVDMVPSLVSVSTTPTKINPGKSIGQRASITVTIQDHMQDDRGLDKFATQRSVPVNGLFWGRTLARNPYYQGRPLRVRTGYLTSPFDWAHFETRAYIIDKIDGPDSRGRITITAKDILKLADNDKAKCPAPSKGKLSADITDVATSMAITTGSGTTYPASNGYVRIGSEIIKYSTVSINSPAGYDTFNTLTRAQYGTTASSHKTNDLVQLCKVFDSANVIDVVNDLLINFAAVPSGYVPYTAEWVPERDNWLSTNLCSAVLSAPEGVTKLLDELCEQNSIYLWWDEKAQKIRLKAIAPPSKSNVITLTDDYHLLAGTTEIKDDPAQRLSQVWVYWDRASVTEGDDEKNHRQLYIQADLTAESAVQYGEQRVKVIKSRWITSGALAAQLASRMLNRFADNPKVMKFALDAKDSSLRVGDLIYIDSRQLVDYTGTPLVALFQILQINENKAGTSMEVEAISSNYKGRYAFVAANGTANYYSAAQADRDRYSWIGSNSADFSDGERYKII